MSKPTYSICIDWDCADWAGAHDFTTEGDDISDDVLYMRISRGKNKDENTYPAATLEMTLNNESGDYYPTNSLSTLYPKVRLWLPVRVRAVFDETTYTLYYGYINKIKAYPHKNKQEIYFYATDGTDLLAKQIIVQDMDDKTVMTDGAAVGLVLDAGGWNETRRSIDVDGGDITNFPDTFEFTKA
jgi:hypothetical protein